jgi:hypothetical protein
VIDREGVALLREEVLFWEEAISVNTCCVNKKGLVFTLIVHAKTSHYLNDQQTLEQLPSKQ